MRNKFSECPFSKVFPSGLLINDEYFMWLAYNQAVEGWRANEVPVGAVIEAGGKLIAASHNRVESCHDSTAHAEILAITQACSALGDWRLNEATLYVTKEPCPMCSGASLMSRLKRVVYGVGDPKAGCLGGAISLQDLPEINHRLMVTSGVLEEPCRELLQRFFQEKRQNQCGG